MRCNWKFLDASWRLLLEGVSRHQAAIQKRKRLGLCWFKIAGYIDKNKSFPRSLWAYCTDGTSIVVGSLLGISPVTVYIESSTGIREGGRTGLTAMTTGTCFFISLFFAPLLGMSLFHISSAHVQSFLCISRAGPCDFCRCWNIVSSIKLIKCSRLSSARAYSLH